MEESDSQYRLRNHMEDVVSLKLDKMMSKMDVCKCDKCRMDIMAYALNMLCPKYIVTEKGDLYLRLSELNTQFDVNVEIALTEAIKVVTKCPRH